MSIITGCNWLMLVQHNLSFKRVSALMEINIMTDEIYGDLYENLEKPTVSNPLEHVVAELESQVAFKIKECQELAQACNRYKNMLSSQKVDILTNLRDSIQSDGLINSDAGTRTIKAITCAINAVIDIERKDT